MCVSPFGPQRVLSGPRCASRDTAPRAPRGLGVVPRLLGSLTLSDCVPCGRFVGKTSRGVRRESKAAASNGTKYGLQN